jgi:sulfur carrier protein
VVIELNGSRARLSEGATVADAVAAAGVAAEARGVAVAIEGEVVRRSDWAAVRLRDGQVVEVVRAVQGG